MDYFLLDVGLYIIVISIIHECWLVATAVFISTLPSHHILPPLTAVPYDPGCLARYCFLHTNSLTHHHQHNHYHWMISFSEDFMLIAIIIFIISIYIFHHSKLHLHESTHNASASAHKKECMKVSFASAVSLQSENCFHMWCTTVRGNIVATRAVVIYIVYLSKFEELHFTCANICT